MRATHKLNEMASPNIYFQKQKNKKPFKLFLQKKIIFHLKLEMLFNIFDGL